MARPKNTKKENKKKKKKKMEAYPKHPITLKTLRLMGQLNTL